MKASECLVKNAPRSEQCGCCIHLGCRRQRVMERHLWREGDDWARWRQGGRAGDGLGLWVVKGPLQKPVVWSWVTFPEYQKRLHLKVPGRYYCPQNQKMLMSRWGRGQRRCLDEREREREKKKIITWTIQESHWCTAANETQMLITNIQWQRLWWLNSVAILLRTD